MQACIRWASAFALIAAAQGLNAHDQSAAALTCMQESYSPEQATRIEALLPLFELGNQGPTEEELVNLARSAVTACAVKNGWTDAQANKAGSHEFSRLAEIAFRKHGPLSVQEIAKLDSTLAIGDRSGLWEIVEQQTGLMGDVSSQEADESALVLVGEFAMEAGFPTEEKAEQMGVILGLMAIQRVMRRQFVAMQGN